MKSIIRNWILLIFICVVGVVLLTWQRNSSRIMNLQAKLQLAERRIASLQSELDAIPSLQNVEIPVLSKRELGRDFDSVSARASIIEEVTVILYSFEESEDCLKSRIDSIVKEYPNIKICVITSADYDNPEYHNLVYLTNISKEGQALETATKLLKSKYFLYLSTGTEISPHVSDNSISWLLHALETIPELDFVGGSILRYAEGVKYPLFEVHCHRLRLCNWTFSQSFEYLYSIDDMMICQETSPSFMGRVSSLQNLGEFDPNLHTMATTDFFFRVIGRAVVGLRPEVRFTLRKHCRLPTVTKSRETDLKLEFMRKYQLHIIKDSWGREVHSADSRNYDSLKYKTDHVNQHTYHGNPLYIRGLQLNMEITADYFESQNITYFLDGGFPLGGLKMRGILPWNYYTHLGYYSPKWQETGQGLMDLCEKRRIKAKVESGNWGQYKDKHVITLRAGQFGLCQIFQRKEVDEDWFMYIYIHGRPYPIMKDFLTYFRQLYGLHYLENRGHHGEETECKIPGHQACVTKEYASGAGHWRDLYCQL